ncbi:uncharacterized protein C8Q71DRAFT_530935 [Rhodofomes roseus]|uniref:Uncharacterized protein n=1 Tax=Rhodofomes roseus TaxID=34475 RepID=A0ABQ8KJZ8_9APHY|nr:uncharacterized protein C8Q71DRAFT_530935 [Rhodofomes roseus]KAH9838447.1 hypothetical protein C8Q71DRAFT_530935 [Rhodofomes roseus]
MNEAVDLFMKVALRRAGAAAFPISSSSYLVLRLPHPLPPIPVAYHPDMAAPLADDCAHMLSREYKWDRPLTRWESLPRLRLEPHRIMFDCLLCGFTNTLGYTCPWCLSACKSRPFAATTARRRISCPQLLSETQRKHMRRMETRPAMATRPTCAVSGLRPGCGATRVRVTPRATTRRQKHRKAGIHSTADIVAAITYDVEAELKPFLKELISMYDDEHPSPIMPNEPVKLSMQSRPDHNKLDDTKSVDASSTSASSQRTLRRKQRMAMLRKRSSRSLRKRSMPLLSSKTSSKLVDDYGPVVPVQAVLPSRSPSPSSAPFVPLGHPERPLYTAIRKSMTPPGLPPAPRSDVANASLHAVLLERGAKSLDMPRPATIGRSHRLREPVPASDWTAGCSITGETELRMDLARCRSADVVTSRGREANPGGVREKVKNLGKGLRELLTRRT